uniref:Adenine phosphoribosyltransferase n=1 Tax=Phallusia mammillata TaxID=59560 RepID=A0A6F9D5V7_9ASCI|nr:adenine phosphoribosyltransferase-like [Phallusia mammillata]
MSQNVVAEIKSRIGLFPNFPKSGVEFKDIFPLFQSPSLFHKVVELFEENIKENHQEVKIDAVLGLDARGFLFGPLLASKLNTSFVPVRKKGKLPGHVVSTSYALEYGEDSIEMQTGSLKEGDNVVIVDDLLATGGTMAAACKLVKQLKLNVVKCLVVIELTGLKGREKLDGTSVYSVIQYEF